MSWLTRMLRNLVGSATRGTRRDTRPSRSPNGASSFHLSWQMPPSTAGPSRLVEVSAVLEVQAPPVVRDLYFWALQVDFADDWGVWGGAHAGLQWNGRYPGSTAVNWGGYFSTALGGGVLPGTVSALPGFTDDPNTMAYPWAVGRPYRLRVFASPERAGAWRAEVIDLATGESSVVRDLLPAPDRPVTGGYLVRPIVWSEVFAACEAPSVTVRWSALAAVDETGRVLQPEAVRVNYQAAEAGGSPNTTVAVDEAGGFLQVTGVPRLVQQGAVVSLPAPAGRA